MCELSCAEVRWDKVSKEKDADGVRVRGSVSIKKDINLITQWLSCYFYNSSSDDVHTITVCCSSADRLLIPSSVTAHQRCWMLWFLIEELELGFRAELRLWSEWATGCLPAKVLMRRDPFEIVRQTICCQLQKSESGRDIVSLAMICHRWQTASASAFVHRALWEI